MRELHSPCIPAQSLQTCSEFCCSLCAEASPLNLPPAARDSCLFVQTQDSSSSSLPSLSDFSSSPSLFLHEPLNTCRNVLYQEPHTHHTCLGVCQGVHRYHTWIRPQPNKTVEHLPYRNKLSAPMMHLSRYPVPAQNHRYEQSGQYASSRSREPGCNTF